LKLYPARCHWTCAEPGWEEVADYALDWALRYARPPVPANAAQIIEGGVFGFSKGDHHAHD
jgi:hypothetical protein